MIIIMSGLPYSGKTTYVDSNHNDSIVIDPKNYYPDDFESLDKEERSEIAIAAWGLSVSELYDEIKSERDSSIIVHDTCGSSISYLLDTCLVARNNKHKIRFIYVNTPLKVCRKRSGGEIDDSVFRRYIKKFKDILPIMKKQANEFTIIDGKSE